MDFFGKTNGAMIERGIITACENGAYIVESIDRDGIRSLPIGAVDEREYLIGDRVYFFLFPDGSGGVLGRF